MRYTQIMTGYKPILYFLVGIVAIVMIIKTVIAMSEFISVRRYIKMEMKRSGSREEYLYWKKRMRSLYKSYIPFSSKKTGK